ncbi:hypothetical protein BJ170DRAFT_728268 [Xylariales sp. AK1849]|nr:hypothetical protein BJ170DRAFT_728268 [Xylariales sp. AK1849]
MDVCKAFPPLCFERPAGPVESSSDLPFWDIIAIVVTVIFALLMCCLCGVGWLRYISCVRTARRARGKRQHATGARFTQANVLEGQELEDINLASPPPYTPGSTTEPQHQSILAWDRRARTLPAYVKQPTEHHGTQLPLRPLRNARLHEANFGR